MTRCREMQTGAPGQSALLMAVIGAMAAELRGVVRASLEADAVVALQVREARRLGVDAERAVG